ncbi:MAG TPA: hypothetical protein VKS01_09535 [Bryobacteraceae bacterium]|nr:hypothetical protein [Bryobacteraceae bacterium]
MALLSLGSAASAWLIVRLRFYRGASPADSLRDSEPRFDHAHGAVDSDALERLLNDDDFEFLARQPGYTREIGRRLRRGREHILRLYLRDLAWRFRRLHDEARAVASEGGVEHVPLIGRLIHQRLAFWMALARIEIELAVSPLGWCNRRSVKARAVRDAMAALDIASTAP